MIAFASLGIFPLSFTLSQPMSFLAFALTIPSPDEIVTLMSGGMSEHMCGCLATAWGQPTPIFLHVLKESKKGTLMDFNKRDCPGGI